MRRAVGLAFGVAALALLGALVVHAARHRSEGARCAPGFRAEGARCYPEGCPAPLVSGARGCDAPDARVTVPATTLVVGPSDWEAEGRVPPRRISVAPFLLDAFEITVASRAGAAAPDGARALTGVSYDEAKALCASRGGRLPTEDEWVAAAAGPSGTRYPWGDTGAVCRRAAFGLAQGPCAERGTGADTVGAHEAGKTPLGLHDMAGNVAEWVAAPEASRLAAVRGGSWRTALAADLRTWARREIDKASRPDDVGVRCAYDAR